MIYYRACCYDGSVLTNIPKSKYKGETMNHYKAKRQGEQEIIELLENAGFENGINLLNQADIRNATKPLFYKIQSSEFADSASIDGTCLYAIFKANPSDSIDSGDIQDFNRVSFNLTIFGAGVQDVIDGYIETVLENLEQNDWYYNFISEEVTISDKENKNGISIIYNINKILKSKNTNKIYTAI